MSKVPFILIIGEKEQESNSISVRKHGGEDLGSLSLETFSELVNTEIKDALGTFQGIKEKEFEDSIV